MHDQIAMGIRNRRTNLAEQLQDFAQRRLAFRQVTVDGDAVDVFHHQEGPAIRGGSAVQEPRDVGVFQAGQDLALLAQATHHIGVAGLHDFNGDQL